jgi:DNA-binding MarR family transcriptional regulator
VQTSDPERFEAITKELLELLDRMAATMFRFTAEQMDKADLSPNRFNALRALRRDEELTMSGLAERLGVSTAAVTSIVDKLEAEDLVHRSRSKTDRRQVFVQITTRGQEAVKRVIDVRTDLIRYMLQNLPTEMQQSWLDLYRELDKVLDRKVGESKQDTEAAQ